MQKNGRIPNFIFELGQLRRVKHEGWRLAGVEYPESVAEHSLRAAQIAYILANLEGHPNPFEICTMLVFHDIAEARLGDIHKVANRYIEAQERKALVDQLTPLGEMGLSILSLWDQVESASTDAGCIARDADKLEQAVTAREYLEQGHPAAQEWINNVKLLLCTESAKNLLSELEHCNSTDWWKGLKELSTPQQ